MAGYVYLLGSRKFHWFKIGKSSRPTIRISELGILLPFKIEVIAIWNSLNHTQLEQELHAKYDADLINGEWFSFSNNQINDLLSEMKSWSTGIRSDFSNIVQDVLIDPSIDQEAKDLISQLMEENNKLKKQAHLVKVSPSEKEAGVTMPVKRGGFQARIDRLIKQNALLKEQIQALGSGATVQ